MTRQLRSQIEVRIECINVHVYLSTLLTLQWAEMEDNFIAACHTDEETPVDGDFENGAEVPEIPFWLQN